MQTAVLATLTSPVILFFVLGLLAALARSDLAIPEPIAKALSIYLMIAIGLKGGVALAKSGLGVDALAALSAGIAASFLLPFPAYLLLRWFGRLDQTNAGAVAAHYGSVSVVTFVTATEIIAATGMQTAGYMVAVLAVMETPAILAGIFLVRMGQRAAATSGGSAAARGAAGGSGGMLHEVFFNASVVLLIGSLVIGLVAGPQGYAEVQPMFEAGFRGVLCVFLLDMGLIAARRLIASRSMTLRLVAIAIALPLINGALGAVAATLIGLDAGSAAAFAILCASASYIAVPAAIRMAVPEADPGIYLTMSLSVTFPFNIIVNIGLMTALAGWLAG
ncbi:MAG: sodium-dependent bicarbonate transport family permease [Erythrobacter sp.]